MNELIYDIELTYKYGVLVKNLVTLEEELLTVGRR